MCGTWDYPVIPGQGSYTTTRSDATDGGVEGREYLLMKLCGPQRETGALSDVAVWAGDGVMNRRVWW